MRNPPVTTAFIAISLLAAGYLPAQEMADPAKTTAYQTSVSQEQLRSMTQRLKGEMGELLDEFGQFQTASDELGKLNESLSQLDTVTETDMAAVVKILREASRMEKPADTRAKLVEASGGQKGIQALLRTVADRLTLQKDAASIQQRFDQLALRQVANLRETRKMAESGAKPDKVKGDQKKIQELNKIEQDALKKEVTLAMDSLRALAEKSEDPADKEAFKQALKSGIMSQLENKAFVAAEKLKSDFTEAAKAQEALAKDLQEIVTTLQSRKTVEEQTRELAGEMKQLAEKQEQLAKASPRAWEQNRAQIRDEQEAISDQLEMAKDQLAKLNPEAANTAEQAKAESNEVAKALQEKANFEKADQIAKTSDAQKSVAEKLDAAGKLLEKQADALAAAENPQAEPPAPESSAAELAIAGAVEQVVAAKTDMALAKRQMDQKGNQEDAKQRIAGAAKKLDAAREQLAQAGDAVPKNVADELKAAAENARKLGQDQSRSSLDRAQQNADRALAGLQQAANQLAAQQAEKSAQAQAPPQGGPKGKGQESKEDPAGPAGAMIAKKGEGTGISAVGNPQYDQREALSLLQQEKAPTEYEPMVQQYIRNLAEAANQGQ